MLACGALAVNPTRTPTVLLPSASAPVGNIEPPSAEDPPRAIAFIVISTLLFAVLWVVVKLLSPRYSVYELTFFRNFFAIIPAVLMLVHYGDFGVLRVKRISGHVWRAVLGITAMMLGFASYTLMPLANAVAISFMSPLVITALSVPLLGEKVGPWRWSAVVIGFVGVLVIVNPGEGFLTTGALVAIGGAAVTALAMITIRQLNRTDKPVAIVFYFALFATLFSALPLPFVWVTPQGWDWALLIGAGLSGGFGQHFMTRAFALAPAAVVSPFNYVSLIWSTLAGWLFWGDLPASNVFFGAAIVIASGLVILWRETRRGVKF
jgi:drug/metabolite transporter (DMT)-like permease